MATREDDRATRRPGSVFVGREWEFGALRAGLDDAFAGRGRLFLISGEPGIGKTRLAEELATHAAGRGARVLWGRCWEEGGAPAFWPWIQIFRTSIGEPGQQDLLSGLGPQGGEIERMVAGARTDTTDRFDDASPPATPSGEPARFRLFDAAATFIRTASRATPWVLVFDDLHGADRPSLRLLHFVARNLRDMRVLLVGNYRDREMAQAAETGDLLAELVREGRELHLRGLSRADLRSFVAERSGLPAGDSLIEALHDATGGNPFFIEQLVHQWASQAGAPEPRTLDASFTVPRGVREAIRRRLAGLSDDSRRVLSVASFVGREFGLEVLQRVSAIPTERLLSGLAEAVAAGLIDTAAQSAGRYQFAHALLRETLYEEVALPDRIARHQRIAEALEELCGVDPEPRVAELAHHFFEAAAAGGPVVERALQYAQRAGDHAARLLAYEEAALQYARAVQLLDRTAPNDVARFELLMALGGARWRAGEQVAARAAFQTAARLAKSLAAPQLLARAALSFTYTSPTAGVVDQQMVDILEEALDALEDGDSALRATLMGRLAHRHYYSSSIEFRRSLSAQAVDMARQLADPRALAYALSDRLHALWGPDDSEDMIAVGSDIVRLAREAGDIDMLLHGYAWRITGFLELGRLAEFSADIDVMARLAEEVRMSFYPWTVTCARATLALLEGRFATAEQLAREAYAFGRRAQEENAPLFALHLWCARYDQGRLGEVESAFDDLVAQQARIPLWRCARAVIYSETGQEEKARAEFEQLAAGGFSALPRDHRWMFAIACLAEVCAALADAQRAPVLYQMLLPFQGRNVVFGHGWVCGGSFALALGRLATSTADWQRAARHYEAALECHARMGAPALLARTQHEYARMLVTRDEQGDHERALELVLQALATADRIDAGGLKAKLETTRQVLRPATAGTAAADVAARQAGSSGPHAVFVRDGRYWRITFQGEVFRLKDASGLHYIRGLLRQPGRKVHLTELLAATEGGPPDASSEDLHREDQAGSPRASHLGDAGALLDPQAKAAYRQRLAELRDELEEAKLHGQAERALEAEREIEFLTRELARAVGWKGRDRRAASDVERARIKVAKAIKVAVRRIEEACPVLGRHLATAIKTGTFCSYFPDPSSPLRIEL